MLILKSYYSFSEIVSDASFLLCATNFALTYVFDFFHLKSCDTDATVVLRLVVVVSCCFRPFSRKVVRSRR